MVAKFRRADGNITRRERLYGHQPTGRTTQGEQPSPPPHVLAKPHSCRSMRGFPSTHKDRPALHIITSVLLAVRTVTARLRGQHIYVTLGGAQLGLTLTLALMASGRLPRNFLPGAVDHSPLQWLDMRCQDGVSAPGDHEFTRSKHGI